MDFTRNEAGALVWLTAPSLAVPGAVHGFSTRLGGVSQPPFDTLNLSFGRGDDPAKVRENFGIFCAAIGAETERMVCARQVHGDAVRTVTADDAGKGFSRVRDYEADGLITDEPDLPLVIFTADCIPVLLFDPVRRAVGACHCGWRGTALGIAARTVERMVAVYGTDPADLRCAVGPGISRCCFETDGDVPEAMRASLGAEAEPLVDDHGNGKFHVDLKGINRLWLLRAGVRPENISVSNACTAHNLDAFFSHRRMGPARGSLASVIQLVPCK